MGMIYQVLNEAWTALRRNRTRSALTMLGIVWVSPRNIADRLRRSFRRF